MAGPHKLDVGSLPFDISEQELRMVFQTYGAVDHIQVLPADRSTPMRRAHILYREKKAAEDAIQVLNNLYKIRVDAQYPISVGWAKAEAAGYGGSSHGGSDAAKGDGKGKRGGAPEGSHKLFIGGLPEDITEGELRQVFQTYGEVVHVHIMKASEKTGMRGAFVFYATKDGGEDAIKVLNDIYKIRVDAMNPIQVRWGNDDSKQAGDSGGKGGGGGGAGGGGGKGGEENKLFVGNLPGEVTEDEMKTVFSTYGEVTKIHLMEPHAKSGMRASLVFYAKKESAEDAIKVLNEVYKFRLDSENPIQVKWGKSRDDSKGGGKGGDTGAAWSGGGGSSWQGGGEKDKWQGGGDRGGDKWSGGGGSAGGDSWSASGGGGGGSSWSSGGGDKDKWSGGGGGGSDWKDKGSGGDWSGGGNDKGWSDNKSGGKGGGGDPPGNKLFVANLPEDIQDSALEYVFSTYGKVDKIHIMSNKVQNGAVAAFVEFNTDSEARTAIDSLNDKYEIRPGFGPIRVNVAKPKAKPY